MIIQLVCIDNYGVEKKLTIGKTYEGVMKTDGFQTISNFNQEDTFNMWRFTPIEYWREKQIDKILI